MIIVGLGNPGEKYAGTRHNIGFMVADVLAEKLGGVYKDGHKGLYTEVFTGDKKVFILKPLTYMNLSGDSVASLANFFKVEPEDILVVHDDMDIEFGRIKFRRNGRAGGHNGIKSVIERLGTEDFCRLKMGIGKSGRGAVGHVLGKFAPDEKEILDEFVRLGLQACESFIKDGIRKAMNEFNNRSIIKEED